MLAAAGGEAVVKVGSCTKGVMLKGCLRGTRETFTHFSLHILFPTLVLQQLLLIPSLIATSIHLELPVTVDTHTHTYSSEVP